MVTLGVSTGQAPKLYYEYSTIALSKQVGGSRGTKASSAALSKRVDVWSGGSCLAVGCCEQDCRPKGPQQQPITIVVDVEGQF